MRDIGLESSPLVYSGFMRENTVDGVYTVFTNEWNWGAPPKKILVNFR